MKASRYILFVLSVLLLSLWAAAAVPAADSHHGGNVLFLNANELQWQDAPPSLPKGAKMAVLYGDPSQPGPFALRFSTPGEYVIPPHYHSRTEMITVLSGTLFLGTGTRFDPPAAHRLETGGFHYLPAKTPHFAFSKSPTVVEIHGDGPFDIIYLDPKDDPLRGR